MYSSGSNVKTINACERFEVQIVLIHLVRFKNTRQCCKCCPVTRWLVNACHMSHNGSVPPHSIPQPISLTNSAVGRVGRSLELYVTYITTMQ